MEPTVCSGGSNRQPWPPCNGRGARESRPVGLSEALELAYPKGVGVENYSDGRGVIGMTHKGADLTAGLDSSMHEIYIGGSLGL